MRIHTRPAVARKTSSLSLLGIASLALGAPLLAQVPADASAKAAGGSAANGRAAGGSAGSQGTPNAPAEDVTAGLPKFLHLVPGGKVEVGLTIDELFAVASQAISPARPDMALKMSEEKVKTTMRRSALLLGHTTVDVQPFLLGKWNVKNSEYLAYVQHLRAAGKSVRAPFHWWRFGRKDDYNQKLVEINKEFPKDPEGPVRFWERYGHELPFEVKDEQGNAIGEMPVSFVTHADANAFAGWLGMRLPTEYEWMRAARGDGKNLWPAGAESFGDPLLKSLQMYNTRDQKAKPTGTVAAAAGPFGHLDMFGQIAQYVADLGLEPLAGRDAFEAEWKKVAKHKVGNLLELKPVPKNNVALTKGGYYQSFQNPELLLIDARAGVSTIDVLEGVGFRLAKSLRPGYDMLFSLLRGPFNRSLFGENQEVDLALQAGAERYELGADGFPSEYHAVSFAPMNWLSNDRNVDLNKLLERAQVTPLLVGVLATTEKLVDPAVPPGIYSVQYRREGMPRELTDAIKAGHKELQDLKKRKAKSGEKAEGEEAPKKGPWLEVITRYGLTEKDLEEAQHATDVKFIRVGATQVSTESDMFLLSGLEGTVVGVIPGTNKKPALGNAFQPEAHVAADKQGRLQMALRFGTPLKVQDPKKFADMNLVLTLDLPAPSAEKPWRVQSAK